MHTILQGTVGSHAFGLNHEASDIDTAGVYIAPVLDILGKGLTSSEETKVASSPLPDSTHHEIAKMARLAMKGNPSALEMLCLDAYDIKTPEGEELLSIVPQMLGWEPVTKSYVGYVTAQLKRLATTETIVRPDKFKKHARHIWRLCTQGKELVETGVLRVRLTEDEKAACFAAGTMALDSTDDFISHISMRLEHMENYGAKSPLARIPATELVWGRIAKIRLNSAGLRYFREI